MPHSFIRGASSLLFVFSATKASYHSNLVLWKIGNIVLIPVSYLCNAYNYEPVFMLADYMTILGTCLSYINNSYVNSIFLLSMFLENKYFKSIETTKNVAFGTAVAMSIANTHRHLDNFHYRLLVSSSISGVVIYRIRYNLNKQNNTKYNIPLTWLFHVCVTNTLYVSSKTAK